MSLTLQRLLIGRCCCSSTTLGKLSSSKPGFYRCSCMGFHTLAIFLMPRAQAPPAGWLSTASADGCAVDSEWYRQAHRLCSVATAAAVCCQCCMCAPAHRRCRVVAALAVPLWKQLGELAALPNLLCAVLPESSRADQCGAPRGTLDQSGAGLAWAEGCGAIQQCVLP